MAGLVQRLPHEDRCKPSARDGGAADRLMGPRTRITKMMVENDSVVARHEAQGHSRSAGGGHGELSWGGRGSPTYSGPWRPSSSPALSIGEE